MPNWYYISGDEAARIVAAIAGWTFARALRRVKESLETHPGGGAMYRSDQARIFGEGERQKERQRQLSLSL